MLTQSIKMIVDSTCVNTPGSYSFFCEYIKDFGERADSVYTNQHAADPGSITYTVVKDHHVEGTFHAVCLFQSDSVVINGTFNGYSDQ